jgi:hypothetical protein
MLLLACMVGLILGGIFYWLAVLSVARSVSNTVSGVGDTLAAPVQVTTIPRQGANFKKSPLDSEALSSPEALLGPGIVGEGRAGPGFELPTAAPRSLAATPNPEQSPAATPAAEQSPTAEASPSADASPTPDASPTADGTPTPQAGTPTPAEPTPTPEDKPAVEKPARAPRLSLPEPDTDAHVDVGAVEFSARIRADSPLAEAHAAVDDQAKEVSLERLDEGVWIARFTVELDEGRHKVWLRASDAEGREGSMVWKVQAK